MITLTSCGGKPDGMSKAMHQIGKNALNIADQYISGEIYGDVAYERMEELYTQAKAQEEKECKDLGVDTLVGTDYWKDSSVSHDISMLSHSVMNAKHGSGAMSEVQEARDNLAETLGEK